MRMVRRVVRSFALAALGLGLLPTQLEFHDLGALIAPRAEASDYFPDRLMVSPFGTIHASLFTFPRLAGAEVANVQLARLDLDDRDMTGSLASHGLIDPRDTPRRFFPQVNRVDKGDRLTPPALPPSATPASQHGTQDAPGDADQTLARASAPATTADQPASPDAPVQVPVIIVTAPAATPAQSAGRVEQPNAAPAAPLAETLPAAMPAQPAAAAATPPQQRMQVASFTADNVDDAALDDGDKPAIPAAQIYFGIQPMGGMLNTMQPWSPNDPIIIVAPADAPPPAPTPADTQAAPAAPPAPATNETIVSKGEVTGEGHHPKSPAERLGLTAKTRPKAEKCLANAVYFEARGEQVRGQIAVAQVVMNRVFSGYYPHDVCGVVYQDSHRHLACQFTFACDGIPDVVNEPDAWKRATEIARDTLDGKLWLPDVGKATHYHAYWVHPWWVREMRKLDRIGVHTFYRPRNWGDGADAPVWGDAEETKKLVKKL
jgi:spore germination cell wall hydrolase CwlJ-like protein